MNALRTIFALMLAAAIVALSAYAAEETPEATPAAPLVLDTTPAMAVAESWLVYVDKGHYAESWEDSAAYFRGAVPKSQWETTLAQARGPLGIAIARKVRSATYTRSLPGAPEGEYVVIQYDTRFENRPQSVETVTPMREKNGTWKVAGYHIR
jgi:predicted lipoprotein